MKAAAAPRRIRCAIYTRKSSDEGLDQAFNSLDAQREACAAYVASQAGEGWTLIAARYDDGGFSGGDMNRPGLKALLADVGAGRIDVVVVYKVDRLTRSLPDFARIVERLDAASASFVSVTQAFNTTTSMGRLTLNVLLSFAQFEREVTGERIRDKIALSKARGMWLGGACPLGYDPPADRDVRALQVNPEEAERVRAIFRQYLELGSVHLLARALRKSGVVTKRRILRDGRVVGGVAFNRGGLFHLLRNRTYLGEIVHKERSYPGLHSAIVDRALFDAVAERLNIQTPKRRARPVQAAAMPLKGLIFDADGRPMSPTTSRGRHPTNLYRYYVSTGLQVGEACPDADKLQRVPVDAVHRIVADRLRSLQPRSSHDLLWTELLPALERVEVTTERVRIDVRRLVVAPQERGPDAARDHLSRRLPAGDEVWTCPDRPDLMRIEVATRMRLRGGRSWVTEGAAAPAPSRINRGLVRALRDAHGMLAALGADPQQSARQLVDARAPLATLERRRVNMALLAPELQAAVLTGAAPGDLTVERLSDPDMPLAWADQLQHLGLASGDNSSAPMSMGARSSSVQARRMALTHD